MKNFLICIWKIFQWIFIFNFNKKNISIKIKPFFSGAVSGDFGGSFVKVKRLKSYFSEFFFGFNIIYILSNAIFITSRAIKYLKDRNIPIILNQNGVFYSGWYKGDWEAKNKVMSVPYHAADYVFWQSEFCKTTANKFLGKRKGPGEILYNCVDTNFFTPLTKKIKKNDFRFLITGRIDLSLEYRIIEAIKGISYAKNKGFNFKLILAGKIDEIVLKNTFSIANKLKVFENINFVGKYNQKNAPLIYQKAHAYVMLKYKDPCPNTVIEALSCGLPVLYSKSGGLPELVTNNCGVGLAVKNSWKDGKISPKKVSIGKGMIQIYKNYKYLSLNARKRAESKFDINFWFERHEKIFKKYVLK